jgi:hypothetical protein
MGGVQNRMYEKLKTNKIQTYRFYLNINLISAICDVRASSKSTCVRINYRHVHLDLSWYSLTTLSNENLISRL